MYNIKLHLQIYSFFYKTKKKKQKLHFVVESTQYKNRQRAQ